MRQKRDIDFKWIYTDTLSKCILFYTYINWQAEGGPTRERDKTTNSNCSGKQGCEKFFLALEEYRQTKQIGNQKQRECCPGKKKPK